MRILSLTTVAAIALAAAACDSNTTDTATDANMTEDMAANDMATNDMASNGAMAMPTDAAGFANAAAAVDMYEIESGKMALATSTSKDIKDFGNHLITDHTKSTADLKTAAGGANVTVMPALDAEKQGMLDQLKAASGAEFDRMFLDQQKMAHQKALLLLQNYSMSGDNAALKAFAAKGVPVIQGHIDHLGTIKM